MLFSMDSYYDRDYYIGLKRGFNSNGCFCIADNAGTTCDQCRATWVWEDGAAMTYNIWRDGERIEPQEGDCARLSINGYAENDCRLKLKFICKNEVFSIIYLCVLFYIG